MPSFLNKVFGYKRHDDKETARPSREASDNGLLDGKYEAIAPVVSPTAAAFAEAQQTKDSDRDAGFSLFRPKARGASHKSSQKRSENVPQLTLRLPGPKENLASRGLGVVFEADPDSQIVLDDDIIAAKRLNPLEALVLIRACAQAITERGLETLGIMHPHWFSASPEVQRRLISLFVRSLTPNRITTLSPTRTSPASAFENELHYTRSPHDVAAVLRWALRHLSLENGHFSKESAEWGWYNAFLQAERDASYPPRGFSELLLPQLPASHVELLNTTLSLISSLASHAEVNSISGSKLSKFLGLWLLVATRTEESDDWNRFYARWERSGRILEHLFLSRLREESSEQRLPTRLEELIKNYPYNKGSPASDNGLLTRPRFSTRQYEALFVRVETLLTQSGKRPKQHPIQLLIEAFQLPIDNTSGDEYMALWNVLKTTAFTGAASSESEGPQFARIFVDETNHLLSSIPADNNLSTSPTPLTTPITKVVSRKRSSSLTKTLEGSISKSSTTNTSSPLSPPTSPTSPSSVVVTDWKQFSLSGFGDTPPTPLATPVFQDEDIEVTQPPVSPKSSRRGKSRTRRRRSEDNEPLTTPPSAHPEPESSIIETKLASVHVVQIDEAFIDFWSDAIVDPISANWPSFVVCGLKEIPNAEQRIHWLVIEQAYNRQEPQASRVPSPDGRRGRSPRPSFKSDMSGFRINSVFSSARKRLSLFSKSATDLGLKKSGGKTPVTGELGEVLVEEEPSAPSASAGLHVDGNEAVNTAVTSGMTGDGAATPTAPIVGIPHTAVPKEESNPVQTALKAPSIEPDSRSEGGCNGSFVLPRPPVRASEETIAVQRDSLQTLEAVHVQAKNDRQDGAVEAEDQPVEPVAQIASYRDEHVETKSAGESSNAAQVDIVGDSSREDAQAVAMPLNPKSVAWEAATPVAQPSVDDEAPEPAIEEPQVAMQSSQKVTTDPAASSAESVGGYEIDGLAPLSATVIAIETAAHLEPRLVGEALEVAEHTEIPTPAPERVTLVEETPGQEISIDVCGHVESPVAQPKILSDATAPLVTPDDTALAAELQDTLQGKALPDSHFAKEPSDDDASVEAVAAKAERAADQVPESAAEGAYLYVQNTIVQTADAKVIPASRVEDDVSAGTASTSQTDGMASAEVEAQDALESFVHEDIIVESQDTEMPVTFLEYTTLVDETSSYESASAITPEDEELVAKTADAELVVETSAPPAGDLPLAEEAQPSSGAELPTQVQDIQTASEALYSGSHPEAAAAALATLDEVNADTAEAKTESTLEAANDEEAFTPAPEDEVTSEIAVEVSGPAPSIKDKASESVAEEAQTLVDVASTASELVTIAPIIPIEEPVAQDEQAPIEIDQAAPQSVAEAANPPLTDVVDPVSEAVHVEEQVKHEAEQPQADTADEPLVEDAESVPRAQVEEAWAVVDDREAETAPDVEDAEAPVETEESAEEDVVSRPEIDETDDADD